MTSTSSVNHKNSYFEHPFLIAIRTYETLHRVKNEIKANTSSVPTTLGGRNHGYLGMILTPTEYRRIVSTFHFTQPSNPGVLFPNPAGTAAKIASTEYTHFLTKTLFRDPTA